MEEGKEGRKEGRKERGWVKIGNVAVATVTTPQTNIPFNLGTLSRGE